MSGPTGRRPDFAARPPALDGVRVENGEATPDELLAIRIALARVLGLDRSRPHARRAAIPTPRIRPADPTTDAADAA